MARKFLLHLRATVPKTEIPERELMAYYRRPKPYLSSEAEIDRVIASEWACGPPDSLRPHTFSTIIGAQAASGPRVGEAIRLENDDVKLGRAATASGHPRNEVPQVKNRAASPDRRRDVAELIN